MKSVAGVALSWNGRLSKIAPAEAAAPWGVTLPETFKIAGTRLVDGMFPALLLVWGESQPAGDDSRYLIRPA